MGSQETDPETRILSNLGIPGNLVEKQENETGKEASKECIFKPVTTVGHRRSIPLWNPGRTWRVDQHCPVETVVLNVLVAELKKVKRNGRK